MPRLLLLLLVAAPLVAQTKYAVVVGVNEYDDAKRLPKLSYAEADAQSLADVLGKQKVKVTLLLGPKATRKAVEAAVDDVLSKSTGKDTLLFAFAGHGQQFKPKGEPDDVPFLCPPECSALDAATQLPLNGLLKKAGDAKVGRALFLLDACRTDPDPSRSGITGNAVNLKAQTEVLFAAANGQKAREHPDLKHGLFMSEVIDALNGKARNDDGEVTWDGLTARVKGNVTKRSKALFPTLNDDQHQTPHKLGSLVGDVVLMTADRKAGEEVEYEVADGVKMVFCWVPPGKATLGSPKAEKDRFDDEKEHEFNTKGFWLGKYEVTQGEWTGVMGTTPFYFHAKGDGKDAVKGLDTSRFPAEQVSWDDICGKDGKADGTTFLGKVNARGGVAKAFGGAGSFKLPHEDEWEYACRGGKGNKTAYYWGDTATAKEANLGYEVKRTTAVGSYAKAAPHPWGLCDMSGNVWEWCENKYSTR